MSYVHAPRDTSYRRPQSSRGKAAGKSKKLPDATDKQLGYIRTLLGQRVVDPEYAAGLVALLDSDEFKSLTWASATIGTLKLLPWATPAPWETPKPQAPAQPMTAGVYQRNGVIYVVKLSRQHKRPYATRLVESAPRITQAGTTIPFELEYAPGVTDLTEAERMTLTDAADLLTRYGACVSCGRTLKAAESVAAGIGPVCAKLYA